MQTRHAAFGGNCRARTDNSHPDARSLRSVADFIFKIHPFSEGAARAPRPDECAGKTTGNKLKWIPGSCSVVLCRRAVRQQKEEKRKGTLTVHGEL